MKKNNEDRLPLFLRGGWTTVFSSFVCVILGIVLGYVVLLCINPAGAFDAICAIIKNFFYYNRFEKVLYYFASTLVKSVPLIFCALSVIFANKTGLFNIGAAGQYTVGAAAALWCALYWNCPWYLCCIAAFFAGAFYAAIIGILKAYRSVNEVISGIMLNWIALYLVNMLLTKVKDPMAALTLYLEDNAPSAMLPTLGFGNFFGNNGYIGIAVLIAPLAAVLVWVILNKTKFGYELRATGYNPNAAFYCGMKQKRNTVLSMAVAGGLAGIGAAMLYLTDIEQWATSGSVLPSVGFDGIAAAFLGGLSPIGAIFSSYFIKHITLGGMYVDKSIYSTQTANLICSSIIYFCAFVQFFRFLAMRLYKKRKREKKEAQSVCDKPSGKGERKI